jgi:hypothetical protein
MRSLGYLGEQLNCGRQGQGSTAAIRLSGLKRDCFFLRLLKEQLAPCYVSHMIYQIFRQTSCTMIGVASWDTSSLTPGLSSLQKGLSHEISGIFNQ